MSCAAFTSSLKNFSPAHQNTFSGLNNTLQHLHEILLCHSRRHTDCFRLFTPIGLINFKHFFCFMQQFQIYHNLHILFIRCPDPPVL